MFRGKCGEERLRRTYHVKLPQATSRLEKTDISSLSQIYYAVVIGDRRPVQNGGGVIRMVMKHMTMGQVIRLSEHLRRYTSMEWDIDWRELDIREKKDWYRSDRDYFWVLALRSFCSKGYYRQVCLEEIAGYPNAFPFLVLHLNNWVGQACLTAARAVLTHLEICPLDELFITMMTPDKIKHSGRKDGRIADALPVSHGDD